MSAKQKSVEEVVVDVEDVSKETNAEVNGVNGKKLSYGKLTREDSLEVESSKFRSHHAHGSKATDWATILHLAFQSIGIVYGDIGTSPLYVYSSTFPGGINHNDDILGVLSIIFYTLTLITLIKYVFIVLQANDNGDGGTFALYSLVCRYAKVSLIPNQQLEDQEVSNYHLESPNNRLRRASRTKAMLELQDVSKSKETNEEVNGVNGKKLSYGKLTREVSLEVESSKFRSFGLIREVSYVLD